MSSRIGNIAGVKRGIIRDRRPKAPATKTRELTLANVRERNPGMHWAETNAHRDTIITKAHNQLKGRYRGTEIIQRIDGVRAGGPYVVIPKQKDLPRGGIVIARNSAAPVNMQEMLVDIEASNRAFKSKPAHIMAIYEPTARHGAGYYEQFDKSLEYYQVEDIDKVFHGRVVSAAERETAAKIAGKTFNGSSEAPGPLPLMKYIRKGSKDWHALGRKDADLLKRDMLNRGLNVLPGGNFGGRFSARDTPEFDPVSGAKLGHAEFVVGLFPREPNVWNLQGLARAAKGDQKQYVVPVFIPQGGRDSVKIRYLGFQRIGNKPGLHPKVLAALKQSNIGYAPNWWLSGRLDKHNPQYDHPLTNATKNRFFAGPVDYHIPKNKRNPWAQYWGAGRHRRDFSGKARAG